MSTQQKYIDIKEQKGQYWLENIMKDRFAVSMFGQKRLSREGGIEIVVKELCTRMARDGTGISHAGTLESRFRVGKELAGSALIYLGTFIKYYKISQLIHTQIIAN